MLLNARDATIVFVHMKSSSIDQPPRWSLVTNHGHVLACIAADPDVHGLLSAVGSGGSSRTGNTGRVFIHLKDRSQRKHSVDQVIQALRPKLAQIPGIKVFLQNPPAIRLGGHLTKSLYQYTLQGPDLTALYHWASLLEDKLKTLPDLQEVTSDMQITSLQAQVDIDRDRAAALGVTQPSDAQGRPRTAIIK